jgi:hypothetical protein
VFAAFGRIGFGPAAARRNNNAGGTQSRNRSHHAQTWP